VILRSLSNYYTKRLCKAKKTVINNTSENDDSQPIVEKVSTSLPSKNILKNSLGEHKNHNKKYFK
jgi:hypothetical protein